VKKSLLIAFVVIGVLVLGFAVARYIEIVAEEKTRGKDPKRKL
jgi:hypothetical protein